MGGSSCGSVIRFGRRSRYCSDGRVMSEASVRPPSVTNAVTGVEEWGTENTDIETDRECGVQKSDEVNGEVGRDERSVKAGGQGYSGVGIQGRGRL